MGRPRKPTSALELSGAFKHDPQRRRAGEPVDDRPIGYAPKRLPAEALPFWKELVDMLPGNVLSFRDRWAVELAARLMAKAVGLTSIGEYLDRIEAILAKQEFDQDDFRGILRRLIAEETISSAELSTLRSLLGAMGMTPADRSKLSVPTEKPRNPFSDFAEENQEIDDARPN